MYCYFVLVTFKMCGNKLENLVDIIRRKIKPEIMKI